MKTIMFLGSALLLTTASFARAADSQEPASVPSETATRADAPTAVPVPPQVTASPTPAASEPAIPQPQAPVAEPLVPPLPQPEPYTGWGRGVRAPMYFNMMFSAGAFTEDGSNRLTTRDSKVLEGFGGVLRLGAVLGEHHRLGARLQSFVRPTKKVLLDPPATTTTNDDWGAVTFGYVGPEYLYTTDLGLYVGGSLGVAGAMSSRKFEKNGEHESDHLERGSAGIAGIVSLGYEWRANKWFAMNAEVFGGLYHGIDDNENSMNDGLFGLSAGLGF
jgi:hypothetical protein